MFSPAPHNPTGWAPACLGSDQHPYHPCTSNSWHGPDWCSKDAEQLDRAWGILQMCVSQLLSYTFLTCCLVIGMASGAPSGRCSAGFASVNLPSLRLMSKRIPNLAYGRAALCDVPLKEEMFLNWTWGTFVSRSLMNFYIRDFFFIYTESTSAVDTVILSSIHWNKEGRTVETSSRKLTDWPSSDFHLRLGYGWLHCKLDLFRPGLGSILAKHPTEVNNSHVECPVSAPWCLILCVYF